ncbi:MAG: hypothetical protein ACOX2G_13555 [Bacillota bacterium]|jgi:hypothetical protein
MNSIPLIAATKIVPSGALILPAAGPLTVMPGNQRAALIGAEGGES